MVRTTLPLLAALSAPAALAYAPPSFLGAPSSARAGTRRATGYRRSLVMENFGFDFAENSYFNTGPDGQLLGEARYKTWVGSVNENSFLNRQYNVLGRVREVNLLQKTVDSGVLAALEKNGLQLKDLEALLPLADKAGALYIVANNQQLLLNGVGFLAVEGAPFILPVLGKALDIGPLSFFGGSAVLFLAEAGLVVQHVKIPFVGLDAGLYLGALLVPLAGLLGLLGTGLLALNNREILGEKLSGIDFPDLPALPELPKVDLPKVDLPKFELPTIGGNK